MVLSNTFYPLDSPMGLFYYYLLLYRRTLRHRVSRENFPGLRVQWEARAWFLTLPPPWGHHITSLASVYSSVVWERLVFFPLPRCGLRC